MVTLENLLRGIDGILQAAHQIGERLALRFAVGRRSLVLGNFFTESEHLRIVLKLKSVNGSTLTLKKRFNQGAS